MKITIFIALLLFPMACTSIPKHIQVSDQLVSSYNKETKNDGLQLVGSGGSFMHDIQGYDLDYVVEKCLTVNETRRLYIKTMENLLDKINSNPQVRPYLHTHPFTIENVKVMISFHTPDGKSVDSRYVALVFSGRGKICYCNYKNNKFNDIHEETYADALRIVRGNN